MVDACNCPKKNCSLIAGRKVYAHVESELSDLLEDSKLAVEEESDLRRLKLLNEVRGTFFAGHTLSILMLGVLVPKNTQVTNVLYLERPQNSTLVINSIF